MWIKYDIMIFSLPLFSKFFQVITQIWVLLLGGLGLAGLLDVWVGGSNNNAWFSL